MKHYDELGNIIWAHHKPGRSPQETNVQNIASQNRAGQAAYYGTAQGTDSQFEGPVQDSPYYKSLVATGTDATSNAYQNAQAGSIAGAEQAGFGQNSPIGQAASREQTGQEATALAQVPTQAMNAAAPLSLQAAGQTANMGTQLGNEGVQYQQQGTSLEEQYDQMNQGFWNNLEQAGGSVFQQNPWGIFGDE